MPYLGTETLRGEACRGHRTLGTALCGACVTLEMLAGVLVEVYRRGEWYVLLEKATATVNRLLRFSPKDKGPSLRYLCPRGRLYYSVNVDACPLPRLPAGSKEDLGEATR